MKGFLNRQSAEVKNAAWIVGGRVAQMLISLIVNLLTARFLGPSNYGLINYGLSYTLFFTSLCSLGINSIIVKNFNDDPDREGTSVGTSIVLKLISSLLSLAMIFMVSFIADGGDPLTLTVVMLCSLSLLFQAFDTIMYWFQNQYKSKVSAMAGLIAYIGTAIYRVIILITQKSVVWFAFASACDYILVAVLLVISYKRYKGPRLRFSIKKAKELLGQSHHYILANMMVAIYGQSDKIILKQMVGDSEVGYYAAATAICAMWVFVLQAIIDSMYPTIIRLHKTDYSAYERKNRQLYAIIFYVSVTVAVLITLLGDIAIYILYGEDYMGASIPLKICTWYTAFSFLGVARNAWVVCENKQKHLKYIFLIAAIANVSVNLALIPLLGAAGSAIASLITNILTAIILPLMIKDLRPNAKLMLDAIRLKDVGISLPVIGGKK